MAVGESAGSVFVTIDGDVTPLAAEFAKAETLSRSAGQSVASSFSAGAATGAGALENFGKRGGHAFEQISQSSRHAVSDIQAVSGTLRTLDGNQGIRAAERFLTMIPGLAPALQAAFPVIGAIAFAEVIARAAEHFGKLGLNASDAAQKVETAFRDVNTEVRASNDSLQVGNDRLENEVAKIEHKPANGIKLALDEAIQAADELGKALDSDLAKLGKTVSENKVGILGQILGKASTSEIEAEVKAFQDKVAKASQSAIPRQESIGGISFFSTELLEKQKIAAQTKTNTELNRLYSDELIKLSYELKTAMAAPGDSAVDSSQKIEILRAAIANLQEQQRSIGLRATNANLRGEKEDAEAKAEAERQAAEEHKKIVEALAKYDQDMLDIDARGYKANTSELIKYWESRLAAESQYAERDEAINRKLTELHAKNESEWEKLAARGTQVTRQNVKEAEEFLHKMSAIISEGDAEQARATERTREGAARVAEIEQRTAGELKSLDIKRQEIALEGDYGRELNHTNADVINYMQQRAELEHQEREAKIEGLKSELAIAETLSGELRDLTKIAQLKGQIAELTQQDANASADAANKVDEQRKKQSIAGQVASKLPQGSLADKSTAAAADSIAQAVDGISSALGRSVVQGKNLGKALADAGKQLAMTTATQLLKAGLSSAVNALMQMIPAFHATAAAATASEAAQKAAAAAGVAAQKTLAEASVMTAAGEAAAWGFESVMAALPFPVNIAVAPAIAASALAQTEAYGQFAAGTDSAPGGMALVGEKGPELVKLPRGSQVIPNHRIMQYAAGTPGYSSTTHYQSTSFQTGSTELHFHAHGMSNPDKFIDHVMRKIPEALKRRSSVFAPASR